MEIDGLKRNLDNVLGRVKSAADKAGSVVTVVGATKTVPADIIMHAVELGVKNVGENRVREYLEKRDAVKGAKWHFIGTLQRNKAKYLVGNVELIQSVSSAPLADEIARLAAKRNTVQRVLIEVNIGGEASKTGAPTDVADELIGYAETLSGIEVCGLMAVPPKGADDKIYAKAYELYAKHKSEKFNVLSVGMSGDYERAIANGSNMVRLGTALFGQRN